MKYNTFIYLYPPRPSSRIKPHSDAYVSFRSKPGYTAQFKLNGQRNMIVIHPDGRIEMWNRHGEQHRTYDPPDWLIKQVSTVFSVESGKFTILDGELLHLKDKTTKNILYVFDILVYNGEYLLGTTYDYRYNLLLSISGKLADGELAYLATDNIWMARNIPQTMWDEMWLKTSISYVEGYVIKKLNSKLIPGARVENNGELMIRCRKPKPGNYDF